MSIILVPMVDAKIEYLSELITLDPEACSRAVGGRIGFDLIATVLVSRGESDQQEIVLLQRGYVSEDSIRVLLPASGEKQSPEDAACEAVLEKMAEHFPKQRDKDDDRYDLATHERTQCTAKVRNRSQKEMIVSFPLSVDIKDITPAINGVTKQDGPYSLFSIGFQQPKPKAPRRQEMLLLRLAYRVELRTEDFILRNCPNWAELEIKSPAQVLHNLGEEIAKKLKASPKAADRYNKKYTEVHTSWQSQPYDYEIALTTETENSRVSSEYNSFIRAYPMEGSRRIQMIRPREPDSAFGVSVMCSARRAVCDVAAEFERLNKQIAEIKQILAGRGIS